MSICYLAIENNLQYETIIIKIKEPKEINENTVYNYVSRELDSGISGKFIQNILSREMHFINRKFGNNTYYGWTISEYEFEILDTLIYLYPMFIKYNTLSNKQ